MIVNKVYKGTTPFVKGYKGTTVIFEEGRKLPSEYQQVEYIKTTSYQNRANYIVTDISVNRNTVIQLDVVLGTDYDGYGRMAGTGNGRYLFTQGNPGARNINYEYGMNTGGAWFIYTVQNDVRYTLFYGGNYVGWYQNNQLVDEHYFTEAPFTAPNPLDFFYSEGGDRCGVYYFYGGKVWDCSLDDSDNTDHADIVNGEIQNATLIGDFVPCYVKATNEVGLYDLVTEQFYSNQGNVPFVAGGNV